MRDYRGHEIHGTHDPEPDGERLYRGGHTCRRCCRFVAFEGALYTVADAGIAPCRPGKVELRNGQPIRWMRVERSRVMHAVEPGHGGTIQSICRKKDRWGQVDPRVNAPVSNWSDERYWYPNCTHCDKVLAAETAAPPAPTGDTDSDESR